MRIINKYVDEIMIKNVVAYIWMLFVCCLTGCYSQSSNNEKNLIELDKPEIIEEHSLDLPTGAISLSVLKIGITGFRVRD
jgi:hypothetical protein